MEPLRALRRRIKVRVGLRAWLLITCLSVSACGARDHTEVAGNSSRDGRSRTSVVGEQARDAVPQLHEAGFATVKIRGRWSSRPRGIVLAQHLGLAGQTQTARLVTSMGPRQSAGTIVDVPGVGTCDLKTVDWSDPSCRGGPVVVWVKH